MVKDWRARAEEQGFTIEPMLWITELPEGGRIEVTDAEIVPMGAEFGFRQLTYTRDGDLLRPRCQIVFEVRNRVPVCASIQLSSAEGGSHVRTTDLDAINIDNLRDDVYAAAGVLAPNPDGGFVRMLGRFQQDRKRVERTTRRHKVTPEFLSQVAEVYNSAPERGRLAAIRAAFFVSQRTAIRYKNQAQEMGLIK